MSAPLQTWLGTRAARRAGLRSLKLRGPGWTRTWRKGRTKRQRPTPEEVADAQGAEE